MRVWDAIYTRRSERKFVPGKEIPEADMEKILDATRYAWSPFGAPAYRHLLIKDEETKTLIAEFAKEVAHRIFGQSYEIFRGHLWYLPGERVPEIAEYSQTGELWTYPQDCSFVVIPLMTKGSFTDGLFYGIEDICTLSAGMALENMWLVAHSLGWGSACNAMPLNDIRRREIFYEYCGIPSSWQSMGAFSVGHRAARRASGPSRATVEGIAFEEMWGARYVRRGLRKNEESGSAPTKIPDAELDVVMKELASEIYKFDAERSVEFWKIEKMVDAARWAPNPENLNHWRHIIIRDEKTKDFIAQSTREGLKAMSKSVEDLSAHFYFVPEEDRVAFIEYLIDEGWKFAKECDTIVLTTFARQWAEYAHSVGIIPDRIDYIWASATGCGIQNMRLAAKTLGLDTIMNIFPIGEMRRADVLCTMLGIPQTWVPVSMLHVGYASKKDAWKKVQRPLPSLDALVFDEYWGVPWSK
jgi:nitroreductase